MNRKEKFKKILLFALLFLLPLISINPKTIDSNNYAYDSIGIVEKTAHKTSEKDNTIELLNKEAITFVKKYHPNCPDIIPLYIVKAGLEHNIDICFMLAQTQLETNFGKSGIGRMSSRHSLFGVERRHYSNYVEAIDDYILLLKTSYLVKGRTEQYLLKNYINKSGYRYAGNPNYEVNLNKYYKTICNNTKIKSLQNQYKKLS